jgi:hypothetical protein
MLEINPVLAGTFDQPGYAPATNNLASNATEDANGVDTRRYTQFDRTAADSGSTTDFSFSDLLDLLNPLEHIPLLSSAYRAITGDNINPVSRVAGDIIYSVPLGGASALVAGVGAVADVVIQAKTGQSTMAYAANALFGSGETAAQTQAASAASTAPAAIASVATATSNIAKAPVPATVPAAPGTIPLASAAQSAASLNTALNVAKAYPLAPNKLPYGGVMDTGDATKAQNMAIALSEASPGLRIGHTIYTGRLMSGLHQSPQTAFPTATAATASTATTSQGNAGSNPQDNYQLPQALLDDISALKALNQYKSTASAPATLGSTVNTTN